MPTTDLFAEGLKGDWKVTNAAQLQEDLTLEADIVIVGSGAGGATSAEMPRMRRILQMLLPSTLPSARSPAPA